MIGVVLALLLLAAWGLFLTLRARAQQSAGVQQGAGEAALTEFVVRSLELHAFQDVLADAAATAQAAFAAPVAVVFEPGGREGVWDAWAPGPQPLEPVPDAAKPAFAWFRHNVEVVVLDELSGPRYGAMRLPLGEFKQRYGVDLLVPLVDRRQTLAVLGLRLGRRPSPVERGLIDHLRVEATAAAANVRLHREAAVKLTLEKEVDLASAVARALVPAVNEGSRGSLSWVGHARSSAQAGSDFWSAYELEDGRLLVVVGDVIGTGVAGSMVSAAAKSCCDLLASRPELTDPGHLLTLLNRALYRAQRPIHMTCFAAVFDPAHNVLSWANAGHPMPYVAEFAQERLAVLTGSGSMLGDEAESRYQSHKRRLAPGDQVLLFTDGLVEAMNAQRAPFGERRLQRVFAATRGGTPRQARDQVLAALDEFRGGVAPGDDEVLVIVKRG